MAESDARIRRYNRTAFRDAELIIIRALTSRADGIFASVRSNRLSNDSANYEELGSSESRPSLTTNERHILGSNKDDKSEEGENIDSQAFFEKVRAEEIERINTDNSAVSSNQASFHVRVEQGTLAREPR